MCKESATADDVRAAMPHPVVGSAADPIALEPVDVVVVVNTLGRKRSLRAPGPLHPPGIQRHLSEV